MSPLSQRTLYNILEVCAVSTQKSLQGLDYISTNGSDAVDALNEIVKALADNGASTEWATETISKMKAGKRYLKTDYKVHVQRTDNCADHCIQ